MITLPAILNPLSRRKDRSIKLSFETRELLPAEVLTLMALEGAEMWLGLSENENTIELPSEPAKVDPGQKSDSERLRAVLYVYYLQETKAGKYLGLYENFKREEMEKVIGGYKSKLN